MNQAPDLLATLKQTFGYDSFRPLQAEIMNDTLAGKDVFALLPTGGGKSLCYQLPALVRDGLTVVISPLISLMKDQVDSLTASGVAATYLNSTLGEKAARSRLSGLHNGEFRLLYIAPERLSIPNAIENLRAWNVNLIAVDEAHCISEWGHDFRPEYRQLANMRSHFPDVPMMALTATATDRVRDDIVSELHLREPGIYIASFNRPNLTYRVVPKSKPYDQLFEYVRARRRECGIVYCSSRKSAERVAERLCEDGVKAKPYHAGLTNKQRAENQEMFLRDEVHVICATIAFGMGINKPNVRFVVHYDLPKNIEGYYQETGRAGRDGLPSDCMLLFSAADVIKQTRFIDEKAPKEQKIAREQLQKMVHYAESRECRRVTLLRYFSEEWPEDHCGGCDNCLAPRETFDGTLAAQKLLSCVYRIRRSNGFGVGLNHIVEVLTGADTARIRKWRHEELSTYGIGKEMSRPEWQSIGRELIRLGLLAQSTDKFSVIEVTDDGMQALRERRKITLTRPAEIEEKREHRAGEIPCDEILFEQLRRLRRKLADERDVPAYIILSDVALRQMANRYPETEEEFAQIPGIGSRKLHEFSAPFLAEIIDYLKTNPRQVFEDSLTAISAPPRRPKVNDSAHETVRLFRAGKSVSQIAEERGFVVNTILNHLAAALEKGESLDVSSLITNEDGALIEAAFKKTNGGIGGLKEIKDLLGEKVTYGQLHLWLAMRRSKASVSE